MSTRTARRVLPAIGLMFVFAVVSACAPAAPPAPAPTLAPGGAAPAGASIPEITVNAADYSFTSPDSIQAGYVRVKLVNAGQEPHHVQFMRLNDNVTFAQFQQALQQGEEEALALVTAPGGVGAVDPNGGTAEAIMSLTPGNYVLACFIASPDGVPHLAKGMLKPIQVAASTTAGAAEPSADVDVRLKDFAIDMPGTLPAGITTFKITNQGPELHEWNIFRLAEGKTMADVNQFFSQPPGAAPAGPPPFSALGGLNGLSTNASAFVEMDLQPGSYVAICNIPSAANNGQPHSALGMVKEFTVQ